MTPERTLIARQGHHLADKSDLLASLPLKAISDGLIKKFFDTDDPAIPVNYLSHQPTFIMEYERHYEVPEDTPVVWLGLLFSMLCLAARFYESEHQTTSAARSEYAAMSNAFYQRANECIDLVDITYPPQGCVEFMSVFLHIYAADFRGQENDSRACFVTGDTVRIAMRMGYPRDPAGYGQFTPFEIEIEDECGNLCHRQICCSHFSLVFLLSFEARTTILCRHQIIMMNNYLCQ